MKLKNGLFLIGLIMIISCGKKQENVQEALTPEQDTVTVEAATQDDIEIAAAEDDTAVKVKEFLLKEFLAADLEVLTEKDRKFQYENVDLNGDGVPESFVRFSSGYYCGTGGCTFLLLDNKQNLITKFTVMNAPIYVAPVKKNGWSTLLVRDRGKLKELAFDGKKYPDNPSVAATAKIDAPSDEAKILFEKPFEEGTVITF